MNPLDTYFVNRSHNPGKLTFVNASFWEKRTAIHKPRRPFNFDLKTYPSRTILREVSRVSSLILRAKPWLAKKVLRVRRRYFSEGEKRRPEMRLRFAGYSVFGQIENLEWIKFLRRHLHQIRENWAGRNFITALRVNSQLITHARMRRSIWNLQLATDSTFK